jgi:hypothetical protein
MATVWTICRLCGFNLCCGLFFRLSRSEVAFGVIATIGAAAERRLMSDFSGPKSDRTWREQNFRIQTKIHFRMTATKTVREQHEKNCAVNALLQPFGWLMRQSISNQSPRPIPC